MEHTGYGIGLDTGGTYTDAVLIDLASGRLLGKAKEATTYHDLGQGAVRTLARLMKESDIDPRDVKLTAISTTLATNAVVEGKGARVGLIVIGDKKPIKLPVAGSWHVSGGHKFSGEEAAPLDIPTLLQGLNDLGPRVDGYAVVSAMSFINASHEHVAAKAISLTDPKPVFLSSDISSKAGMEERAATCVLHARLMPLMQDFLRRTSAGLESLSITCPMVILQGDLGLMDVDKAGERAASSVASGPAASVYYGSLNAPSPEHVVVDVGGTTTDVTMILDREPALNTEGALIGGMRTHIPSVEMATAGVGGDSYVRISGKGLKLGPERVLPMCTAGSLPDPSQWISKGLTSKLIRLSPQAPLAPRGEGAVDQVLQLLSESGPVSPGELATRLKVSRVRLNGLLEPLLRRRLVQECGFTPTDALHVLGRLDIGEAGLSRQGARELGRAMDMEPEDFCRMVVDRTTRAIEDVILSQVLYMEVGHSMAGLVAHRSDYKLLRVDITLQPPIIGLGAAARELLPLVAERLGCELILPDHYEVGNAMGAILLAASSLRSAS